MALDREWWRNGVCKSNIYLPNIHTDGVIIIGNIQYHHVEETFCTNASYFPDKDEQQECCGGTAEE